VALAALAAAALESQVKALQEGVAGGLGAGGGEGQGEFEHGQAEAAEAPRGSRLPVQHEVATGDLHLGLAGGGAAPAEAVEGALQLTQKLRRADAHPALQHVGLGHDRGAAAVAPPRRRAGPSTAGDRRPDRQGVAVVKRGAVALLRVEVNAVEQHQVGQARR